jgi:hypothetical protein
MGGNQLDVFWKIQPQRRCQENRLWFQNPRLAHKTNTHQKMTTGIWKIVATASVGWRDPR